MSTIADLRAAAPSVQYLIEGVTYGANNQGYAGTIRFYFEGQDLSGFSSTVAGVNKPLVIGGKSVTRAIPLLNPYINSGNCYADNINIYTPPGIAATTDPTGDGIAFPFYFADVHFSTPNYPMESGDYPTCTIELDTGVDRVTRPGSSYLFPSDGKRLNHDIGVRVHTSNRAITLHRLTELNVDLYDSLTGCVNEVTFMNKPPGTVLYMGPRCSGQFVVAGLPVFDVTHLIEYRAIPHNEIMRPDGKGFEAPIQSNYGGDGGEPDQADEEDVEDPIYMFPEADLNALFGD